MPVRRIKVVNHHRLIKKIDRATEKTERWIDRIFRGKKARKVHDYAWKGTHYNPYIQKDTSGKKKIFIKLGILFSSTAVVVYLTIFSGLFDVNEISISGTDRIPVAEVEDVVKNTLAYKNFGVIPNSSFFVANTDDIIDVLKARFPIQSIQIEKKFPHHLSITIEEKLSTIVYDNGELYGLIGLDGTVIELTRAVADYEWQDIWGKVVTTTENSTSTIEIDAIVGRIHHPDIAKIHSEVGDYPIIYDMRGRAVEKGDHVIDEQEALLIVEWYNKLKLSEFVPKIFIIENNLDLKIETIDAWDIKTRFTRVGVDDQLREIHLAADAIKKNGGYASYIDIRYKDRIFWK